MPILRQLPHIAVGMRRLLSTSVPSPIFDVVIVGGGVVGAALAARLATLPSLRAASICLVEARAAAPPPAAGAAADARTYALSPTSIAFLESSKSWAPVAASNRVKAFNRMSVWETEGPARLSWGAPGGGSLGTMVEHNTLAGVLWDRLTDLHAEGRITLKSGAQTTGKPLTLSALSIPLPLGGRATLTGGSLAELTLSDGFSLRARLVVGADGANSAVRTLGGGTVWGGAYASQAAVVDIVRIVQTESNADSDSAEAETASAPASASASTSSTAFQRFLPDGPLALLPMWGGLASVVWSTTPERARSLATLSPTDFAAAVDAALHHNDDDKERRKAGEGKGEDLMMTAPIYLSLTDALTALAHGLSRALPKSTSPPPPPPPHVIAVDAQVQGQLYPNAPKAFNTPTPTSKPILFRSVIPLSLKLADAIVRPRLALIGDAARSMHPLAGQGLNQGLLDAAALADAVGAAAAAGGDAGSPRALHEYATARSLPGAAAARGVDAVLRLWAGRPEGALGADLGARAPHRAWQRGGLLPALRALALSVLDAVPGGKAALAAAAGVRS